MLSGEGHVWLDVIKILQWPDYVALWISASHTMGPDADIFQRLRINIVIGEILEEFLHTMKIWWIKKNLPEKPKGYIIEIQEKWKLMRNGTADNTRYLYL